MTEFKTELRIGTKLHIGFTAEQFEDWRDRLEGLLKARGLHGHLISAPSGANQETGDAQTLHILRENVEYPQLRATFKTASNAAEVWAALCKRWEKSTVASKLLVAERLFSLKKPPTVSAMSNNGTM